MTGLLPVPDRPGHAMIERAARGRTIAYLRVAPWRRQADLSRWSPAMTATCGSRFFDSWH
jgi:hypothetical protein